MINELNGVATDPSGNELSIGYLPFYHRLSFKSYDGAHFYSPNLVQTTIFTGSETDVLIRFNAALGAGAAINQKDFFYPPGGLGENSNSVATTLLRAMGLQEPDLPTPSYRFVPGKGTSLLDDATIQNIRQIFGIPVSPLGSSRVVDIQSAANNPDGSITIFTSYKDGTSTIAHYSQGRFEETLYGGDGGELGNVNYSAAGSGKASATIRGQVGEVNFHNTNVTVLQGGQVTAMGSGVNLLVMPNSTVQTTTFNSTITTLAGANLSVLGSNNNVVLGRNTAGANLGGTRLRTHCLR